MDLPKAHPSEMKLEDQLQAMGMKAPRVTPAMVDAMIEGVEFHHLSDTHVVCKITLFGGRFHTTGESATVSKENFDGKMAEEISYQKARSAIFPYAGAILANDLFNFRMPLSEEQLALPDYAQRMILEVQQVHGRLEILAPLVLDKAKMESMGIDEVEANDLTEQVEAMTRYRDILQRRLSRIQGV
jgi:hypothetical protein